MWLLQSLWLLNFYWQEKFYYFYLFISSNCNIKVYKNLLQNSHYLYIVFDSENILRASAENLFTALGI